MNNHNFHRGESSRKKPGLWPQLLIGAVGIGMVLADLPARASESQTPWECSSYTGDAHTRCVEAFAESQRDQIATLQEKVQAQQETVNHLKDQLDRQASTNADLQRLLVQPPAIVRAVPPLYAYPAVGLGLYFGRPWIYGPSYFHRPYVFGPRHNGPRHRGHRW
ncbi:MAG: hypothetical protein SGJ16_13710 [Nitrospirota bacterium]|nr:hypothetical protein [Nitrospirota bacterium]